MARSAHHCKEAARLPQAPPLQAAVQAAQLRQGSLRAPSQQLRASWRLLPAARPPGRTGTEQLGSGQADLLQLLRAQEVALPWQLLKSSDQQRPQVGVLPPSCSTHTCHCCTRPGGEP